MISVQQKKNRTTAGAKSKSEKPPTGSVVSLVTEDLDPEPFLNGGVPNPAYSAAIAAHHRRHAAEYAALGEQRSWWSTNDKRKRASIADVLAHASGTCEPDPLFALVAELELGLRTYRAALESEVLLDGDHDELLYMLERRAAAALELVRRTCLPRPLPASEAVATHDAAAEE